MVRAVLSPEAARWGTHVFWVFQVNLKLSPLPHTPTLAFLLPDWQALSKEPACRVRTRLQSWEGRDEAVLASIPALVLTGRGTPTGDLPQPVYSSLKGTIHFCGN